MQRRHVGGILIVVGALVAMAVIAGRPRAPEPLQIGEDTTRIAGPLDAEGLPDYLAVLNDVAVPAPEDNAAIPLLRALGTNVLEGDVAGVLAAIGAPPDLPDTGSLVMPDRLDSPFHPVADFPPLSPDQEAGRRAWVEDNVAAREALGAACRCEHLWTPCVRIAADPPMPAHLGVALPAHRLVHLASLLTVRAEMAVEDGDLARALDEVACLLDLARLVGHRNLLALGFRDVALHRAISVVASPSVRPPELRRAQQMVLALPGPEGARWAFDEWQRFVILDALLRNERRMRAVIGDFDMNAALRRFNERLDAVLPLLSDPDRARLARLEAMAAERRADMPEAPTGLRAVLQDTLTPLPPEAAGQALGDREAAAVTALAHTAVKGLARAQHLGRNLIVATSLRLHALETGAYPARLEDLVPARLAALPGHPLLEPTIPYERTEAGCRIDEGEYALDLPAP